VIAAFQAKACAGARTGWRRHGLRARLVAVSRKELPMSSLRFLAMPTATARAFQAGEPDAYGHRPEIRKADGPGFPCRHCLTDIAPGEDVLVLAYRPFSALQPYAETGPVFLHARLCERHPEAADTPDLFLTRPQMLVRGYSADERIVYGTGVVVPSAQIAETAARILERPEIAFVDLRSASNNCFQCRVERGQPAPRMP
jgi:hypothetical protein